MIKKIKIFILKLFIDNLYLLKKIIIAIDGPAASGKSTTAKLVAEALGYLHIDTGAMYRAITLNVLQNRVTPTNPSRVAEIATNCKVSLKKNDRAISVLLDGIDVTSSIRSQEVNSAVSAVSNNRKVREVLVREQRRMGLHGGVVLEGRDIGTVVFPNAQLKIFMTAHKIERVKRRKKDLQTIGFNVEDEDLMEQLTRRDELDSTRDISPLKKAEDAIELDTTELTIEEQVEFIVKHAKAIIAGQEIK